MKARNINKVLGAWAFALLLTGCTDGNDWGTDASHNRLFGVNESITIDAEDTSALITFKGVPKANTYIIEISTDSLYDDIAQGTATNSKVYTFTPEKIGSASYEYTIDGLNGETEYSLRIKSQLTTGAVSDSRWVYYKTGSGKGFFKTDAEQLFEELTPEDIDDGKLHVTWQAGAAVTNLVILINGEEVENITLSADVIAAGEYDIIGLAPTTTYTIELYNGEVRRGSLNVTTPASMPAADYKYTLPEGTTLIDDDLMATISAEAQAAAEDPTNYSATIAIPAGTTIDIHGDSEAGDATSIKIPDGMSVTFFGLSGGDKPIISISKSLDIRGSHAYVRFENVAISDNGCQYFINQSEGCTLGELSFKDVTLEKMSRSWIRFQGSAAKAVENLIIDNCIAGNQGDGGYALFYFNNEAYTINTMTVKNSTFFNLLHSFTDCRNANIGSINVSDCTFYNIIGAGRYFVDAQNTTTPINITNSIFALTGSATSKGVREGVVEVYNSYMTNDFVLSSNKFTVDMIFEGSSTDMFVDPANGDFSLKVSTIAAGDPRWIAVTE